MNGLTELFKAMAAGDSAAKAQLLTHFYDDLRALAHVRLRRSEKITALDTTELAHEYFVRLLKDNQLKIKDRAHFLAYSACVMRSIIVDFIRQRHAERRGGQAVHVTLNTDIANATPDAEGEIIKINDALELLTATEPRLVQVVEMRYFVGLSENEIAEVLGVTERTVRRDWQKARMLLTAVLEE